MMDTYVDERDYKLLETDKYTFFVLKRIMGGECKLLLSDHERLILCFTGHPFPVWIWTTDDCLDPVRPETETDGGIYHCEMKDLEEVVDFLDNFHKEIGIDQKDLSGYREDAEAFISTGNMYLWKDEQGRSTASCKYAPAGDMASVNLVFTRPEFRRKHYAENLVYQVTMKAKEEGYVPMLYTDADYVASNACYEKIGYVLRGKLCTIG